MTNNTKILFPALVAASMGFQANASEISTNTAQMQAMDKITGRVSVIDVPVNSEVKFGSFSIVVRDCKTRSPEETPENFAFVDVVDTNTNSEQVNIFRGWMLSSTPALNAIEHPVYDVWLLKCMDTDISQTKKLTETELAERDNIPQQLTIKTSAPVIEDEFAKNNPSGEPINLLPADIKQAGEEKMVEEQGISLQSIEETPQNETPEEFDDELSKSLTEENETPEEFDDELSKNLTEENEHEPLSLLNLGKKQKEQAREQNPEDKVLPPSADFQAEPNIDDVLPPAEDGETPHGGLPQIPETAIPGYVELSEEAKEPQSETLPQNSEIFTEEASATVQKVQEETELPRKSEKIDIENIQKTEQETSTPALTEVREAEPAQNNVFETEGNYIFEEEVSSETKNTPAQTEPHSEAVNVSHADTQKSQEQEIERNAAPMISDDILKELEEELAASQPSKQQ